MRQLRECQDAGRVRGGESLRDQAFQQNPAPAEMLLVRRFGGEGHGAVTATWARVTVLRGLARHSDPQFFSSGVQRFAYMLHGPDCFGIPV